MTSTIDPTKERAGRIGASSALLPGSVGKRPGMGFGGLFERWALVGALVLLVVICIIALPQFRNISLFTTMLNAQSLVLLLALTATIVLRMGDFDLSIAQTMVATAAVIGQMTAAGIPSWFAILTGLALGVSVGLINALLAVRRRGFRR